MVTVAGSSGPDSEAQLLADRVIAASVLFPSMALGKTEGQRQAWSPLRQLMDPFSSHPASPTSFPPSFLHQVILRTSLRSSETGFPAIWALDAFEHQGKVLVIVCRDLDRHSTPRTSPISGCVWTSRVWNLILSASFPYLEVHRPWSIPQNIGDSENMFTQVSQCKKNACVRH